jgi:hypothetical protein
MNSPRFSRSAKRKEEEKEESVIFSQLLWQAVNGQSRSIPESEVGLSMAPGLVESLRAYVQHRSRSETKHLDTDLSFTSTISWLSTHSWDGIAPSRGDTKLAGKAQTFPNKENNYLTNRI